MSSNFPIPCTFCHQAISPEAKDGLCDRCRELKIPPMPTLHDSPEGQTHSWNDGCGMKEHNAGEPKYQSLGELIATMKEVVHREYFSGIREQVVMDSIEQWMTVAYHQGWKEKAEQMLKAMKEFKQ